MKRRNICLTILAVAVIAFGVFALFDFSEAERKLCDAGVYDMLTPELIEMYEREVAGESVISGKTQSQLERSAGRLNIEVNKLKALMLLQDLAGKVNRDISLNDLAAMSDMKLLTFAKQCADDYMGAQSEERQLELKKMVADALKIPINF